MKEKIKSFFKKNWWYVILLVFSSAYVLKYRNDIDELTVLTARNLIFILWLILLILPLFSEIEIGNVKLKKEIEKARAEVKEAVSELRLQIMDTKITNSMTTTLVFGQPLASKEELDRLEKQVEKETKEQTENSLEFNIPEQNTFLFQVRLSLENLLSNLCNTLQYREHRTLFGMVHFLVKQEVISVKTAELLQEIIKITNRGVHGEIINEDYVQFVKRTFPSVKQSLEGVRLNYTICPQCHYSGLSRYSNVCPQCGFVSDDD